MIRTILRLLAILLGAISCANLAWKGFGFQIGPLLTSLLDSWDQLLADTLGLAASTLIKGLNDLAVYLGWNWHLILYDHWRHVYVVLNLYFVRDAAQFGDLNLKQNMWTSYIAGFVVAAMSALCAGLLNASTTRYGDNLAIGAIPVIGFFMYAVVMAFAAARWNRAFFDRLAGRTEPQPFWQFFGHRIFLAARRATIGLVILAIGLLLVDVQSPAILMLAILWLLLAAEWLRRGWLQARDQVRSGEMRWRTALLRTGNINLGLDMFATIGLAITLLALGAAQQ